MDVSVDLLSDETVLDSEDWAKLNANGSPLSESLLTRRSIDHQLERLSLIATKTNDGVAQTDFNLPFEDYERSRDMLKHVTLLRGLLSARQFEIGAYYAHGSLFGQHATRKRRSERANILKSKKNNNECQVVDVIDLTSSPETDTFKSDHRHKLVVDAKQNWTQSKPRKLNFNDVAFGKTAAVKRQSATQDAFTNTQSLRFSFYQPDEELEALQAVQAVVDYIAEESLARPEYVVENWTGSFLELCADTLVRTVEAEGFKTIRLVTKLCQQLLDAIANERQLRQAYKLESVADLVLKLCESQIVALEIVDYVLSMVSHLEDTLVRKKHNLIDSAAFLENSFHILRILMHLLKRIEEKANESGTVPVAAPKADRNVLNLWKNHWRPSGGELSSRRPNQPLLLLTMRLQKLEHFFRVSLELAPLLGPLILACLNSTRNLHVKVHNTDRTNRTSPGATK